MKNPQYLLDMLHTNPQQICGFCYKQLTEQDNLWYWGGMNDVFCHYECYVDFQNKINK